MYVILHSNFFDIIISVLIVLNFIFTLILSIDDLKKDLNKDNNSNKLTKMKLFKFITVIIYVIAIAIVLMKGAKKYNVDSYLILLYYFSFAIAAKKLFSKSIKDLTSENPLSRAILYIVLLVVINSLTAPWSLTLNKYS